MSGMWLIGHYYSCGSNFLPFQEGTKVNTTYGSQILFLQEFLLQLVYFTTIERFTHVFTLTTRTSVLHLVFIKITQ